MVPGAAAHHLRSALRTIGVDALVVITGIVVYFGVRGLTAVRPGAAREHGRDVLALEKELGLDVEAGIQDLLLHLDWVVTAANWVYIWGHWPVIVATLVWLALHDRVLFLRLRNAMIASGAMGLCVYTTYPVAPPRLLGEGFVDTVTERSNSYRVLQPPAFTNQYAAMPSLHVGWDLLVGIVVVAAASTLVLRTLGALMPVAMAAATVITANHYVLDVLVGAAFGLAGYAVALLLERRAERRAAAQATAGTQAVGAPRADGVPEAQPAYAVPVQRQAERCPPERR